MPRICKHCGNEYTTWFCPCRRKKWATSSKKRRTSSRKWSAASARARMLGGWGEWDKEAIMEPVVECKQEFADDAQDC